VRRVIVGAALLAAMAAPALPQQSQTLYVARLGPQDLVNSRGVALGSVCAVVQQDRANYHRFGKRDPLDETDPIFADPAMRAQIASRCRVEPGYEYLQDAVFAGIGYGVIVLVRVVDQNGAPLVLVRERAG